MAKAKKKKKKRVATAPVPDTGRLGADRWIAVRQKTGAGPIEPKPRRGTRADREREAFEREAPGEEGNDL
jgi:hypothetical protein